MFTIGQAVTTPEGAGIVGGTGTVYRDGSPVPRILVRLDGGGVAIFVGGDLYRVEPT
jgi:hypothetical protein